MRKLVRGSVILLAAMVVLATGASGARKMATVKASSGALNTAIFFTPLSSTADNATELERIQAAGAKYTAIHVYWSQIAPSGTTKPAGFQADDPADSNYKWAGTDNQVKAAVAAGLKPMVFITQAPEWAEGSGIGSQDRGSHKPSPSELAKFVTAAATRYSGSFDGLPRVQYWAIWNEPNLNTFLDPQVVKKKAFSPAWYRSMLNAAADAIHGVSASNVVIGGETAPFGFNTANRTQTRPITFMENVLCVKEKKVVNKKTKAVTYTYKASCKTKTKFDVWSHHPYTQGGPTMKSPNHGNASLGDMGAMRSVLNGEPRRIQSETTALGDGVQLGFQAARSGGRPDRTGDALGLADALSDADLRGIARELVPSERPADGLLEIPIRPLLRQFQRYLFGESQAHLARLPLPLRCHASDSQGQDNGDALGANAGRQVGSSFNREQVRQQVEEGQDAVGQQLRHLQGPYREACGSHVLQSTPV
jgi:hypothetical protein